LRIHPNWIGVSRYSMTLTLAAFPGIAPRHSAIIYYPITDVPAEAALPKGIPREFVLFAGHVNLRKGALRVAEACRHLLVQNESLHIVYVGAVWSEDGIPMDQKIRENLGDELGVRCLFMGNISRAEVLACMRKAKAFIFPSQLETFGIVVAEAMMQGCPVIVNAIPPFTEFVTHEQTGLLVAEDSPEKWAEAVSRAIHEPQLMSELSGRASKYIREEFSAERHTLQSLAFYARCLAGCNVHVEPHA